MWWLCMCLFQIPSGMFLPNISKIGWHLTKIPRKKRRRFCMEHNVYTDFCSFICLSVSLCRISFSWCSTFFNSENKPCFSFFSSASLCSNCSNWFSTNTQVNQCIHQHWYTTVQQTVIKTISSKKTEGEEKAIFIEVLIYETITFWCTLPVHPDSSILQQPGIIFVVVW